MKEIDELYKEIKTDHLRKVFEPQAIEELSEQEQERLNNLLKKIDRKIDNGQIEVTEEEFQRLDYELPALSREDIIQYLGVYYEVTNHNKVRQEIRRLKQDKYVN